MAQEVNLSIVDTCDNKIIFVGEQITITVDKCSYKDGKHLIADPKTASAFFECCGTVYNVDNTVGAKTVEDWLLEELIPKRQMLDLLLTPTA